MMKIYLTNLGKYNEGELVGEWVELPITNGELEKVLERIGINEEHEEYFITDYECNFYHINEYDSVKKLNEIAEKLNELDEEEREVAETLISDLGFSVDEAIETVENGDYRIYYDCSGMDDVAYQVVQECGYLENVPENVARYFDYESFGRDLSIEGTFLFMNDDRVVEVLR